jgi:hypothetical protein
MAPADDSSKNRIAGGDIGHGAHKPSEKHTLDEVLKSLQDLIRNELLEVRKPPEPPPSPDPSAPRKRGRPRKPPPPEPPARETPAPPLKPEAEVEAVMSSLEHLVEHELNPEDSGAGVSGHAAVSPVADELTPPSAQTDEIPAPPPSAASDNKPARRGDQHEFSFDLDAPPPAGPDDTTASPDQSPPAEQSVAATGIDFEVADAAQAAEAVTPDDLGVPAPESEPPSPPADLPAEEETTLASPAEEAAEAAPFIEEHPAESDSAETFAHELAFDDIPVLQDMVTPPPAGSPAADDSAPAMDPQKLRDLSIRAVARLNIELRKQGEPPLDARLIDRLQRLLREEMEKTGKGGS